jgi:dTDP-4-dehydrorhamnose reductase
VARAADACGAVLVHYSTDFVFDGETDRPYEERDAPSPQSVYAMSKLVGEWFALESPRAFVLRVESLFGMPRGWSGRRSSLEGIVLALEARAPVKAFTDRVVSPSHVGDVAAATRHLLQTAAEPGLYHCVNSGHGTWFELAREAARVLDAGHVIEPVTMSDMPLRARRPRYCALSNRKLDAAGFAMPSWQDALRRWMAARVAPIE